MKPATAQELIEWIEGYLDYAVPDVSTAEEILVACRAYLKAMEKSND